MHKTSATAASRHSLVAGLTVLAPAVLVLAFAIGALGVHTSAASSAQAAIRSITIRASAPRFPKQIPAGLVSVTLVNDGKSGVSASFASANPGATLTQITAATTASNSSNGQTAMTGFLQLLKLLAFLGGPENVPVGGSATAIVNLWRPGLAGVHINTDAGASQTVLFNVTAGGTSPVSLPAADVTVTLKDFKFGGLPKHLAAGTATFELTNTSVEVHEMQILRLTTGKTQKDLLAWAESPQGQQSGPPPAWVQEAGGLDMISPRRSAELTVSLTPGYYVVVCMMPDVRKANFEPHFMEGMIGKLSVS
jgi:hypothetical protein